MMTVYTRDMYDIEISDIAVNTSAAGFAPISEAMRKIAPKTTNIFAVGVKTTPVPCKVKEAAVIDTDGTVKIQVTINMTRITASFPSELAAAIKQYWWGAALTVLGKGDDKDQTPSPPTKEALGVIRSFANANTLVMAISKMTISFKDTLMDKNRNVAEVSNATIKVVFDDNELISEMKIRGLAAIQRIIPEPEPEQEIDQDDASTAT